MILPDINLLVYAHNEASRFHPSAKAWWLKLMKGSEPLAVCWPNILGFIRIVTHPGIHSNPLTVQDAFSIVDTWLDHPVVHWLHPGSRHYLLLQSLLNHIGTAGNLVTDAHLAALAIENNCELHSNDTDFSRFPGLKWVNPL